MKAVWREIRKYYWQYHAEGYAVFGTIEKYIEFGSIKSDNDYYCWSARVMDDCRNDYKPITGKSLSLEKAKRIVETICIETDTLSRNRINY